MSELTITEFLLARVAEREDDLLARGTTAAWHSEACIYEGAYEGTTRCDCGAIRFSLAECEAKRELIDWIFWNAEAIDGEWGDGCTVEQVRAGECHDRHTRNALKPLRLLAQPYRDHADFDPKWVL